MLKTLKAYIGEYKKTAISAPIFIVFEVIFEMIIPLLMAAIIDNGLETGNMKYVITMGLVMLLVPLRPCSADPWRRSRRPSRLPDLRKM